jgi:hypothetical protein
MSPVEPQNPLPRILLCCLAVPRERLTVAEASAALQVSGLHGGNSYSAGPLPQPHLLVEAIIQYTLRRVSQHRKDDLA